jgi:hypothetical protein
MEILLTANNKNCGQRNKYDVFHGVGVFRFLM